MSLDRTFLRKSLLLLSLGLIAGVMLRALFVNMAISGLQAEAKLMLSYMHTLQRAQNMESGTYIAFENYYGAALDGQDNCEQPEGAAQLGFLISWCHSEKAVPMNFAYRSVLDGEGFYAEAKSGSDEKNQSFVCFGVDEVNVWKIDKDKQVSEVSPCVSKF